MWRVTWRAVVAGIAKALRRRADNCRRPVSGAPDTWESERKGQCFAYASMADELDYIATLAPHEGLRELRTLIGR